MSGTFLVAKNGEEREQWNNSTLADAIAALAMTGSNSRLAIATFSIFHIANGTARKVWQGTPEDARAGRGYVTEEPAPEIPPCKYPVGTVLRLGCSPCQKPTTVTAAKLSWVYSYVHPDNGDATEGDELKLDRHYVVAPPAPYPVGSEHVVDLGLLGKLTVTVTSREGERVTFVFGAHQCIATVDGFEKAVVK